MLIGTISLRLLATVALWFACVSIALAQEQAAINDGVTTAIGAGLGLTEANPLGLATIALKIPLLAYVKTLPVEDQKVFDLTATPIWNGAAINNVCMILALLTGGTLAPVCLAAGLGYATYELTENADERAFYAACGEYRRVSGEAFRCVYRVDQ